MLKLTAAEYIAQIDASGHLKETDLMTVKIDGKFITTTVTAGEAREHAALMWNMFKGRLDTQVIYF